MEILDILGRRWSPRCFDDKAVEQEKLQNMMEAARLAPSAMNEQPWYYFIGRKDDETYRKIFSTLVEFNQLWAIQAPLLMMACGRTKYVSRDNSDNRYWDYDVGQSVAYLTLQATYEGLFCHQMGGFDTDKTAELFHLPEEVAPIVVIAVGYMGNPETLPDFLRTMENGPNTRKSLESFIFGSDFGIPYQF